MPKKLIVNNFFNSLGKETSRMGNAFAAAGLMYYFVSAGLNLFLEDEFEEMAPIHKNMICGGFSGLLFKSTLGVVPATIGTVLGVGLIGGLTKLVEEGNQRGLIAFEMK
jgi:import inner membrane translocase subunit TIM23